MKRAARLEQVATLRAQEREPVIRRAGAAVEGLPFALTAGSGLTVLRAAGKCKRTLHILPTLEYLGYLDKTLNAWISLAAASHAVTASRYNVVAIRATYRWVEPSDTANSIAPELPYAYETENVKTLAQLTCTGFSVVVDTIDTDDWESEFATITPDTLADTLSIDLGAGEGNTDKYLHFPIGVVEADADSVVSITQILNDHLMEPFGGNVLQVDEYAFGA